MKFLLIPFGNMKTNDVSELSDETFEQLAIENGVVIEDAEDFQSQFNSEMINSETMQLRIVEDEEEDEEEVEELCTRFDFGCIFDFATKEFGIGWNPCNDLFFNCPLDYKSFNEYDMNDVQEWIQDEEEIAHLGDDFEFSQVTKYMILHFDDDNAKAMGIIGKFMESKGISYIFIDNT